MFILTALNIRYIFSRNWYKQHIKCVKSSSEDQERFVKDTLEDRIHSDTLDKLLYK